MMQRSGALLILLSTLLGACGSLPDTSSPQHAEAVRSFYVGLAALDVGDDRRARTELEKATQAAPGEPAAWNNLGVLQLRQRDLEGAGTSIEQASKLAPENAVVTINSATVALQRGDNARASAELEKASTLAPDDLAPIYLLADLREREAGMAEALQLYSKIAEKAPENLAARIEVARLEARSGDTEGLKNTFASIERSSTKLSPEGSQQLAELRSAVESGNTQAAAAAVSFLRNVLLREPWFRQAIAEFKPSETTIGTPIYKPLKLAAPNFSPAEPDREITFTAERLGGDVSAFALPIYLNADGETKIARATGEKIFIGEQAIETKVIRAEQIAQFDFDFDFRNDLAIASSSGLKIFKQGEDGTFADATASTKLNSAVLGRSYDGVWPLDVEHDGDLDLIAAPAEGPPVVLQNNGDGSFTAIDPFPSIRNVRTFAYADIDEDGDADAIFLTADGKLRGFLNERGGKFVEATTPEIAGVRAFAIGDVSGSGRLEVVAASSKLHRITKNLDQGRWEAVELSVAELGEACPGTSAAGSECSVFVGDIDNNGANDVVISAAGTTRIISFGPGGGGMLLGQPLEISATSILDRNGDGKLDIVGLGRDGQPAALQNQSAKNYRWQVFRPRAGKTEGDQRVNSFGIGGEMEVRTGVRTQKQLITSPAVHFGLGEATASDVLRIVWNNGFVQAEFDLASDQAIAAEQRLKGSCPHLFAWNGERFEMVKDAPPWSPALGLKINAQDTFGIIQTEEWFKIPGSSIKPKEGQYELRITGEYWESFYLDHYKLLAIDHPETAEVFTDERFAVPPPPLEVFTFEQPKSFSNAIDQSGRDVAEYVRAVDENYLDGIERGKFQGVAEDHWVELSLPEDAPSDRKLTLIADGWLYPTDASINVQLGQSSHAPPQSLSIEVPDGKGGWRTAKANLGFPAGKMKTVLLELPTGHRRFRLRTNMEIYWDRLAWSTAASPTANVTRDLVLGSAELRYRGFSVIDKPNASSPEVPLYDQILTTGQRWRDLEGYYTRFGDVKELLTGVDGRLVLMNAGDELVLKFPVLPDPPPGFKRDFVIVGNGWIKDGDFNSVFSKTLLPLPSRETNDYSTPPGRLEDDPVFKRFREDWVNFHTRYVAPDGFRSMVRNP